MSFSWAHCVHVCVRAFVCVRAHLSLHMKRPEKNVGYLAKPLSTLFLEIVWFTERGWSWLFFSSAGCCSYLHPKSMLGLQACKATPGFVMGARDSNSGLYSWMTSVLTHSVITPARFHYLVQYRHLYAQHLSGIEGWVPSQAVQRQPLTLCRS